MNKKEVIAKITEYLKDYSYEDLELVLIFVEGYHRKHGLKHAKGDT